MKSRCRRILLPTQPDPVAATRQGGRLRGELIEAATRLMAADRREDQVTVRAVARQAGVAPRSFYLHFATIDDLLWDVYASEYATLTERSTSAAHTARDPYRRLFAGCQAYCQFTLEHPQSNKLMFSLTGQPDHARDGKLPGDRRPRGHPRRRRRLPTP